MLDGCTVDSKTPTGDYLISLNHVYVSPLIFITSRPCIHRFYQMSDEKSRHSGVCCCIMHGYTTRPPMPKLTPNFIAFRKRRPRESVAGAIVSLLIGKDPFRIRIVQAAVNRPYDRAAQYQ